MVTINQKPVIDPPQKKSPRESKQNTKVLILEGLESKRNRKEQRRATKTARKIIDKMALNTYLSITSLNVNKLQSNPKDRG